MAKVLHCGKNKIAEPVPGHGFGMGPTKAKAKSAAELKCTPDEGCPKMKMGSLLAKHLSSTGRLRHAASCWF